MSSIRVRLRWLVVGAVVLALVITGAWRLGFFGAPTSADHLRSAVHEGREAFSSMKMTMLSTLTEESAVLTLVRTADTHVDDGVPSKTVAALQNTVATFLRLRFVENDATLYKLWRQETGCSMSSLEALDRKYEVLKSYSATFGKPLAPDATTDSLFPQYWANTPYLFGGTNRLRGITTDRRGLVVRVGYSGDTEYPRLRVAGEMEERLWYGPVSAAMRRWFDVPVEPAELAKRHGRVLVAEIGLVTEWDDRSRRPVLLSFAFDPERQRWFLWLMNQNNFEVTSTLVAPLDY